MGGRVKSHMRVFLSADLVGSTKLKNRLNHQELIEKYRARRDVIAKLRDQDPTLQIGKELETAAVLESLGIGGEDYDWAEVVRRFYEGVHSEFQLALKGAGFDQAFVEHLAPWKAVGDELIYELEAGGRKNLHRIAIAFLRAVRAMDSKIPDAGNQATTGLRVKGAAWVAGFPVRNRQVELPPDKRPDFLGPDMDSGFRIAKCTRAGMLVVSVELAELLGECQGDYAPMLGKIVGWEKLPGVWNDHAYPVIWADFPDSHPASESHRAKSFTAWDQEECRWCKSWEDVLKPKQQLSVLAKFLTDTRASLPASLGLVNPYVLGDPLEDQEIPLSHREIHELLESIERHQPAVQRQGSDDGPGVADNAIRVDDDVASATDLVKYRDEPSVDVE